MELLYTNGIPFRNRFILKIAHMKRNWNIPITSIVCGLADEALIDKIYVNVLTKNVDIARERKHIRKEIKVIITEVYNFILVDAIAKMKKIKNKNRTLKFGHLL